MAFLWGVFNETSLEVNLWKISQSTINSRTSILWYVDLFWTKTQTRKFQLNFAVLLMCWSNVGIIVDHSEKVCTENYVGVFVSNCVKRYEKFILKYNYTELWVKITTKEDILERFKILAGTKRKSINLNFRKSRIFCNCTVTLTKYL